MIFEPSIAMTAVVRALRPGGTTVFSGTVSNVNGRLASLIKSDKKHKYKLRRMFLIDPKNAITTEVVAVKKELKK